MEFKIGEKVKVGSDNAIIVDKIDDRHYAVKVFYESTINGKKYKQSVVESIWTEQIKKIVPELPNEKWGFKIGDLVIHQHRIGRVCGFDKDGEDGVYFTTEDGDSSLPTYCDRPINGKWWSAYFKDLKHYTPQKRDWTPLEIAGAKQIIAELVIELLKSELVLFMDFNHIRFKGMAYSSKCHPNDTPNEYIGMMVALCKAFGKPFPEWLKK